MESHDTDRISSKFGAETVQVFTALKLALPGIDITYYGSEIGMENTYVRADQVQDSYDSSGRRNVESRDFARSPMQWNDMDNAGNNRAILFYITVRNRIDAKTYAFFTIRFHQSEKTVAARQSKLLQAERGGAEKTADEQLQFLQENV